MNLNVSTNHADDNDDFSLTEKPFLQQELAGDSRGDTPFVSVLKAEKAHNFSTLIDAMEQSNSPIAKQVKATLEESGAVLLRGLNLNDTSQAERVLSALGTRFDDNYLGGASPRSRLSDHFFTSTEAPAPYVISFHTEMCYLRQRQNCKIK